MVFVWSTLTKGSPAYTVVQVATNDLIILVAFVPIVKFLLGVSDVSVPWDTLILSVILFVVIPLAGGVTTRVWVTKSKGAYYFENSFAGKFDNATEVGLLLTLILLFSFQGDVILNNPLHFTDCRASYTADFLYLFHRLFCLHDAETASQYRGSGGTDRSVKFFELSVAVAIALFGTYSPAALATVVGVLTSSGHAYSCKDSGRGPKIL